MTALLTVFSLTLLFIVRQHLIATVDRVLFEELRELIEEISFCPDIENLQEQLQQRYAVHAHYHFRVISEDGRTLFRSRFLNFIDLPVTYNAGELRGPVFDNIELTNLGPYRLLTMAMRDSRSNPMLLQVLSPRSELNKEFLFYVWMILGIGPAAVLVTVVVGYFLARGTLQPIEEIASTAEMISADNLSQRIECPNPDDELGRLGTTLNHTFDRLQASISDMRQFTADAAHELRSPLTVMRTEAEIALRSSRSTDDYRKAIGVTLEETNRLALLVDQLLVLSRHDAHIDAPPEDIVPVDALLKDVAEKFRGLAMERGLTFEAGELPEWYVKGDDIQLSQMFYNLLDNAVKYTPASGRILLRCRIHQHTAHYVIENSGEGIPEEHLPHIFKRFYRVDTSRTRATGGTGLGLAICKSIAEAHGGSIQAENAPETGTRFTVILPGRTSE
ncbi:MAG: ATP-binding protein [Planctomycetaceae bacterium]